MFWKLQTNFLNAERDYKKSRLLNKLKIILQVWKGHHRQARSNPTVMVYRNSCTLACTDFGYR